MRALMAWPLRILCLALCACSAEPPRVAGEPGIPGRCFVRHVIDASGAGADGVHLADIDGDGHADVVSGWEESAQLRVYLHPGADVAAGDAVWRAIDVSGGQDLRAVEDAAFADLDGDGRIDTVVSATEGSGEHANRRIRVHRWDGAGPLDDPRSWHGNAVHRDAPTDRFMKVRAAQLDGAHGADIVALSRDLFEGAGDEPSTRGGVFLYRAPEPARFGEPSAWSRTRLADVHKGKSIELVDMDADGDRDILYSGARNVVWLENPLQSGAASGQWDSHWIGTASDLALCDVNADGIGDIVATASAKEYPVVARWFEGVADKSRRHRRWQAHDIRIDPPLEFGLLRPARYSVKSIACGHFSGATGGPPDIVLTASGAGYGIVLVSAGAAFPGDPGAPWRAAPLTPYRWLMKYDNILAHDVDADGDVDLVTSEENAGWLLRGAGVLWYENSPATRGGCGGARGF